MNISTRALALLTAVLMLCTAFVACKDKHTNLPTKDPVNINGEGYSIVYRESINEDLAESNETVAEWLDKCVNDEERDDIGTYILFYEDTSGEKTVYTYLIYRTMLECDYSVKFFMNEDEYIVTAEYTPLGTSTSKTHLSMVQVISDTEPNDIDLIENGDYLGALFTKEYTNISDFIQ